LGATEDRDLACDGEPERPVGAPAVDGDLDQPVRIDVPERRAMRHGSEGLGMGDAVATGREARVRW